MTEEERALRCAMGEEVSEGLGGGTEELLVVVLAGGSGSAVGVRFLFRPPRLGEVDARTERKVRDPMSSTAIGQGFSTSTPLDSGDEVAEVLKEEVVER